VQIAITVNSCGFIGGTYETSLRISSNDVVRSLVFIPVNLLVVGEPRIVVIPDSLQFGEVYVGYSDTLEVALENVGTDALNITDITTSMGEFQPLLSVPLMLAPGATSQLPVVFTPSDSLPFVDALRITSNDAQIPVSQVALLGSGRHPSLITVYPDSLVFELDIPDSATATLAIGNAGLGTLHCRLTAGALSPRISALILSSERIFRRRLPMPA